METNQNFSERGAPLDPQIARLLDRAEEAGSIVDRLLAIPGSDAAVATTEWDRAVARRLERRLSATLRELIEGDSQKHSA
jgi:cob(I)alamin adenosyltransferase